jgi:hypothetical protein
VSALHQHAAGADFNEVNQPALQLATRAC